MPGNPSTMYRLRELSGRSRHSPVTVTFLFTMMLNPMLMKHKSFSVFRLCIVSLLLAGCTDSANDEQAPPVMSAIDDMRALQAAKEQETQLARANAAEAVSMNAMPGSVPTSEGNVPAEGKFSVEFDTTVGKFTIEVNRTWSPIGADRFYKLVKDDFYTNAGFFRVVPNFMVQWGIAGDPEKHAKWSINIQDDPMVQSNTRGYVTFAKTSAPDSRSSQIFINFADNSRLDSQGFSPFGKIVKGMDVVDEISAAHGEDPDQSAIEQQGNTYLKKYFPKLDYIKSATVIVDDQPTQEPVAPPVVPVE